MQAGTPIQSPVTATRIIPIKVATTDPLNKLVEISHSFGIFKVTQLRIVTPDELTGYNSAGLYLALLPTDDLKKITFNFNEGVNKSVIKDLTARTLAQKVTNRKARYNTDCVIDFSKSFFKINSAVSADGWLLLEFTYEK
jgi:hypothetical protein